ncbi:cyclic 3',5'-adenosine monophosphate phosphodiesterase [Anatilimnocola aggregata]|uniref:Cyclic 3',5'-adenosine monophosphate phosphodiesterase n=1 Tax=Anatilimnocola aggregata TaxID=2528021 RepID=A0A517YHB5_9BACT|nr:metallophosphoesterase [Anatilimnocola aggregata]QDU29602.1 cyclic 3',5'-adenosine monophosphate phosphodiesterase [Anatilimnocola aggregata]
MQRRTFLSATTAVATSSLLLPRASFSAEPRPEIEFVVVTDTHLGYKDKDAALKLWSKTAAAIDKQPGKFVLHLGDVVDRGVDEQYPRYLEARQLIKKPVHEIPGNHDPAETFQKHLRQEIDTASVYDWLRVVLVNNSHTDSHDGFLTEQQLAWLAEQAALAAKHHQQLLFCLHVPVHSNKHPDRGWHVKPASGQTQFYDLLKEHEARTLALFHGHFHNGLRGWHDHGKLHEVCFPSALYNLDRQLEAKQAPGYNPVEYRPGYTLVKITDKEIQLRFQATDAADALKKNLAV